MNDRPGSTIALVTTTGGLAGTYEYDPYGRTTVVSGTSTTAAQNNPWRYTGGYQDPGDGYDRLGARCYDAPGHFTQADNIAGSRTRPEKYNSYTYTAGDPVNNTDLVGLLSCGAAITYPLVGTFAFFVGVSHIIAAVGGEAASLGVLTIPAVAVGVLGAAGAVGGGVVAGNGFANLKHC